jgi:hypothetical protein
MLLKYLCDNTAFGDRGRELRAAAAGTPGGEQQPASFLELTTTPGLARVGAGAHVDEAVVKILDSSVRSGREWLDRSVRGGEAYRGEGAANGSGADGSVRGGRASLDHSHRGGGMYRGHGVAAGPDGSVGGGRASSDRSVRGGGLPPL